jgi:tetratricopeptide (TPR) repeat protein
VGGLRDDPQALTRQAQALKAQGQLDAAEAAFARILAGHPHHPVALWNLGLLLIEREKHDEALALADATLAVAPNHGRALLLRGDALTGLAQLHAAIAPYERAGRDPALRSDALVKLGSAKAGLGQSEAALAALDQAVALASDPAFARYRRGIVRLQYRDFGGWDDYEARWSLDTFLAQSGGAASPLAGQLARGPTVDDVAGKRVLVLGEQGVGDQVMFASMLPDLARVARTVTCICDPRLVRLFSASFPSIAFAGPAEARVSRSDIDVVVAIGSLGVAFRRSAAAFPGTAYLAPRQAVRDRWAQRLGDAGGRLRIGLAWRGGVPTTRRGQRSLDLAQLAPLLDLPDVEIVSLQHGDVSAELAAANADRARPITAFPASELHDFEEVAGLAAELDLIVSVQTALVHVAGAICRPCLTLVPQNPEWRYTADGTTLPWYGSAQIFRQRRPGDWAPVIADVTSAVRAASVRNPDPTGRV